MSEDFILCARAVEKNKTSIRSAANPLLQPPEDDLLTTHSTEMVPDIAPSPQVESNAQATWAVEKSAKQLLPIPFLSRLRNLTLNLF
jgi:hypothetical protein